MRSALSFVTRISRHWRGALEVVATLCVIAVCVNLLWAGARLPAAGPVRPPRPPARPEPKLPTDPVSLEGAMLQGAKTAKVALIQYSDFECPFCGKFARETEPTLRKEYVETGRALYAFKHLPLQTLHQNAVKAATVAECAGDQGKFWQVHDLLFQSPAKLDDALIRERAKSADVDLKVLDQCAASTGEERVKRAAAEAAKLGITGTPTLLIGTIQSDGKVKVTQRLAGAQPIERLRAVIDELLGTKSVAGQ